MPPETATAAFVQQLRELWSAAGQPSSREVATRAKAAGVAMSHSTVNDLIRQGKRVAAWPTNAALIRALGGDEEELRTAWISAYNEQHPLDGGAADVTPAPASRMDELIGEVRAVRVLLERLLAER